MDRLVAGYRMDAVFHEIVGSLGQLAWRAIREAALDKPDMRVLVSLLHGPQSQAELGRSLAMDKGQLNRVVQRLRQTGLVVGGALSSSGARESSFSLSLDGRARANLSLGRQRSAIDAHLRELPQREVEQLVVLGARLIELSPSPTGGPFVRAGKPGDAGILIALASHEVGNTFFGESPATSEAAAAEAYVEYTRIQAPEDKVFLVAEGHGLVRSGLIAVGSRIDKAARITLLISDFNFNGWAYGHALLTEALTILIKKGYRQVTAKAPRDQEGGSFFARREWELVGPANTLGNHWEEWIWTDRDQSLGNTL